MATAFRLDQSRELGPADLVLRPDGSIEFHSEGVDGWLQVPSMRERLRACVRGAERGEPLMQHAPFRCARLHARGSGHRYLVHFDPLKPISQLERPALSRRERQVADYVVAGATTEEIAAALSIQAETVKTYKKRIYRKLGVASALELARLLQH